MAKIKTLADIAIEKEKREKLIGDVTNPAVASRLEAKQARDTYEKWLDTSNANKGLENTDLTPAVPTVAAPSATPTTEWLKSTYPSKKFTLSDFVSAWIEKTKANNEPTTTPTTSEGDFTKWTEGEPAPAPAVTPTDDYSNWSGGEIPTDTEPKPETVVTEGESNGKEKVEGKVETEESGFAKWLASDPTIQQRMKQAEADYYKNRAGYGVSGETLAQSGLIGSGWSSAMDAAAYSAMQAEKAGVRSEGYAKWLNEGGDTGGNISKNASELFNDFLAEGLTELTEADNAMYIASGWSQSDIDEAKALLKDYRDKEKAEFGTDIQEQLGKLSEGESVENILSALGVDTSGMDADTIGTTFGNYLDQAVKEGLITAEERSKYLTDDALKDIEELDVDAGNGTRAKTAAGIVDTATEIKDSLTEADYKTLIDAAFDTLNVQKIVLGKEGMPADEVRITVQDADGKTMEIIADWTSNPKDSLEKELTKLFGSASLAVYDDKIYYQYKKGGWREIDVKVGPTFLGGSQGSQSYGQKVLKTVAQYVSDNKIDYRGFDLSGYAKNSAEAARAANYSKLGVVPESIRRKYIDGRMTRDEFVSEVAGYIAKHALYKGYAQSDSEAYARMIDEYLADNK